MNSRLVNTIIAVALTSIGYFSIPSPAYAQEWTEVTTIDGSLPTARHESNAVVYNGMIYLFGGRGERPVDRFDPNTNTWEVIATTPLEMHHFQPVIHDNKIYIIGAFTCCYPSEPTIADIHVFDPADNTWSIAGTMPEDRLRGSAGAVSYNNKIYLIGGNTAGHSGGAVGWLDEYDPSTGNWTVLPDAPTARDHFSAAVINNKLFVAGGRQTARSFDFTVPQSEIFDFASNEWRSVANIPTQRAGTMTVVHEAKAIVIGGESQTMYEAHDTVEGFNPFTNEWHAWPSMINPRHAGGAALIGNELHVFAGSTVRGAAGESSFHEVINLANAETNAIDQPIDGDNDGLTDIDENTIYFTDPTNSDTDGDNLSDYHEVFSSGTDPNNIDSDNDQVSDGDELLILFTDANNADTDSDGIEDGTEVYELGSNPLAIDSDLDGLADGTEYNVHGTSLITNDTDSDGLTDQSEIEEHGTNPLSNDTDNDAVSDYDEILIFQSDPLLTDTDGDGISDGQEIASGTSLNNIDDDNDGLTNYHDGTIDSDGDGLPNYADRDSDNDGIPDLVEIGFTDVNHDGQLDTAAQWLAANPDSVGTFTNPTPTGIARDTDGDGVADYIDLDSDQDGIPDLAEASSIYSTSSVRHSNQIDGNRDGLIDSYNKSPADEDRDTIPNHLDLDSDDDGINDLQETGSMDVDDNGLIDGFVDNDGDGLADFSRPALGNALPDADNDSLPDLVDSYHNDHGLLGCTLSTSQNVDPLFLSMLLLSMGSLLRRREKPVR